jgi:hypothetical protein
MGVALTDKSVINPIDTYGTLPFINRRYDQYFVI